MADARAEFLLEVGCEEIPAGWLGPVTEELRDRFAALAAKEHLAPEGAEAFSTPRRLVLRAEILERQPDREEDVYGPALKVAKDAAGNWTKAAEGFARKSGTTAEALSSAPKDPAAPAELYLVHRKRTPGREAAEVLPGVLAAALRGLSFPKRMSWDAWLDDGKGAFPFGRPIRWLVALLDGRVVPFGVYALEQGRKGDALVRSGDRSLGHRFLPRESPGRPLRVASFAELERSLLQNGVVLRRDERLRRIREALAPCAAEIADDHGLVEDWAQLVEHPSVVFGRIPAEFQSLPREVLETVLVHHQKYLPLGLPGSPVSRFAAVTNIDGAAAPEIARGMERVVVARLRDAAFFYAEDLKRPLAERVADLDGVSFHQKLGSYAAKAERLAALVDAMALEMGALTRAERELAREAARLCKADLTTLMVREFPELQGVMGGLYLKAQGAAQPGVADAVRWHYHPVSVEADAAPAGRLSGGDATVFAAVSLADKLDTLAGYFGIGVVPTGSSDPYGLRRAAQGAVRVLIDFWQAAPAEQRPSLRRLVGAAIAGYRPALPRPAAEVASELQAFLLERLRYLLTARGAAADEADAALGAWEPDALDDPHEAAVRLAALQRVRSERPQDFEHLAVAFKRARNILGEAVAPPPDPALFETEAERALFAAVTERGRARGSYEERLRSLSGLRGPVDRFFDDVLVMAEDARVRANRLGLLQETLSLFYRIADISKLGG